METFLCRAAKSADHEDITEISKSIYNGVDYTSSMFLKWLADVENWQLYVVEDPSFNKVVAFLALNITDNKTRVTLRSGRVAESMRGQGIYKLLLDYALQTVQIRFSEIRTVALLEMDHGKVLPNHSVKEKYDFVTVVFPLAPNTKTVEGDENAREVSELALIKLSKLYENQECVKELIPEMNMTIDFSVHNIDLLESRVFLDSQDHLSFLHSERIVSSEPKCTKRVLSVVDLSPREDLAGNFVTSVDFYGNDGNMLRSHVMEVLRMVEKVATGLGKNIVVIHMGFHSHLLEIEERKELLESVMEGRKFEVLDSYTMQYMESDVKKRTLSAPLVLKNVFL